LKASPQNWHCFAFGRAQNWHCFAFRNRGGIYNVCFVVIVWLHVCVVCGDHYAGRKASSKALGLNCSEKGITPKPASQNGVKPTGSSAYAVHQTPGTVGTRGVLRPDLVESEDVRLTALLPPHPRPRPLLAPASAFSLLAPPDPKRPLKRPCLFWSIPPVVTTRCVLRIVSIARWSRVATTAAV